MTDISIQAAREHIAEGEKYLAEACRLDSKGAGPDAGEWCAARAGIAAAHFAAASAITNVLLTDPAEFNDVAVEL